MDDESGGSMEPMEEVPLKGLDESELEWMSGVNLMLIHCCSV